MEVDIGEALHYLGAADAPDSLRRQVEETAQHFSALLESRYVYRVFSLEHGGGVPRLAELDLALPGETAGKLLEECGRAAVLVCTLGARFDAALRAEQVRDMARAVILDALGSAAVERGCDRAERELTGRFPEEYLTDRFSPGYGDLPLALQGELCGGVDAPRRLGVQVTESLLLNPAKTVTAVIGIAPRPQMARIRGCGYCSMREDCPLRKGGTRCGV